MFPLHGREQAHSSLSFRCPPPPRTWLPQGALRHILAEVAMRGRKGTTLTGATLLQHGFYGKREGEDACSWTASATGRLRIPTLQSMR